MPRYRRQIASGSVQHIISRFVNREFRFDATLPTGRDARREYLRRAARALHRSDWRALGFALMSSHVHWAMQAGSQPSSSVIKPLHAGFAGWLNTLEGRLGPVFADRHRNLTFEGESAVLLIAYIHNNPVRAGIVGDPVESRWTSHRAYLGLVAAPPWLDVKLGLHLCGFDATAAGRLRFHEMVVAHSSQAKRIDLSGGDVQARRRAIRLALRASAEISSPRVVLRDDRLRVEVTPLLIGNSRARPMWNGPAIALLREVSNLTGTTITEMRSRSREQHVVQARRLAMVTWTRELHRPAVELGRVFGLTTSTTSALVASAPPSMRAAAAALATRLIENRAA
jgi:REP element-mobilizing transposase RayT